MIKDYGYLITQLEKRLDHVESEVAQIKRKPDLAENDWDKATLMKEWNISLRTVAHYQKQGLKSFKRGGRVYFSPKHRNEFIINSNCKYEQN